MYDGYLELGGNEVLNRQRAFVYTHDGDCPVGWLQCGDCPGLDEALGDDSYEQGPTTAPWYDEQDEPTGRFYGAYPITMRGLSDSTRIATITEGILDGGTIQGGRRAVRQVRCTALLIGHGMDALEAGMSWLDAVLDQEECSTHGGTCGEMDACFFVACPAPRGADESLEDYEERTEELRRQMHGVVAISGPIVTQELERDGWHGFIVEFTLAAATPFVYSMPQPIALNPIPGGVFQDNPLNLVEYPSAELTDGTTATVATNYSTNPSVENNATDWAWMVKTIVSGVDPTAYFTTVGRTTTFHSVGLASYTAQLNVVAGTPAGTGVADIDLYQQISLAAMPAAARPSFNIYGAAAWGGAAPGTSVDGVTALAEWRTGTTVVRTDTIGSTVDPAEIGGRSYTLRSVPRPAGVDNVRVILRYRIHWQLSTTPANNSNIRLFADALAVTVP